MKRVTMRDIAKVAKVSQTAVSMALRDHREIPEATRKRIAAIALRLGYRPDPALASLNSYRIARRPVRYHATLAWINPHPHEQRVRLIDEFDRYFLAASKRAEELGYKLEEFWVHQPRLTPERLTQIFVNRGIQGLLLAPTCGAKFDFALPWESFSTVAFGYSHDRRFHLVSNDQYYSMRTVFQKLCALGYRRIGCHISLDFARRCNFNFTAGYLMECQVQGRQPLLRISEEDFDSLTHAYRLDFKRWVRKEKPDAVILFGWHLAELLAEMGLSVPGDVAVAMGGHFRTRPFYAGLDQNPERIGRTAIDQLSGLIQRNEFGYPPSPLKFLVAGHWLDGDSCPPKGAVTFQKQ